MALVHFIARTLLAFGIASAPTSGSILRPLTLLVVILVAVVWGGIDGINDRRANPDPDNSSDLTITWLKASVVAGLLSGLVTWLFSALFSVVVTSNSLIFELTSGAAFTILLVFIPAVLAVSLGRLLAGRDAKKNAGDYDDDRPVPRERERAGAVASSSGAVTGYTPVPSDSDDDYSQSDYSQSDYDRQSQSDSDTEVFEPVRGDSTTNESRSTDLRSTDSRSTETRSSNSGPSLSKQAESRDTWEEPR